MYTSLSDVAAQTDNFRGKRMKKFRDRNAAEAYVSRHRIGARLFPPRKKTAGQSETSPGPSWFAAIATSRPGVYRARELAEASIVDGKVPVSSLEAARELLHDPAPKVYRDVKSSRKREFFAVSVGSCVFLVTRGHASCERWRRAVRTFRVSPRGEDVQHASGSSRASGDFDITTFGVRGMEWSQGRSNVTASLCGRNREPGWCNLSWSVALRRGLDSMVKKGTHRKDNWSVPDTKESCVVESSIYTPVSDTVSSNHT